MNELAPAHAMKISTKQLRLGFLGVGWIGRHRMQAMLDTGLARATVLLDPSDEMLNEARKLAPDAVIAATFEDMLASGLDGIVIATPSALHAQQAIKALEAGLAVFCQKPLGRSASEVAEVVAAAKHAGRLLGVDFSYRHTAAMQRARKMISQGALGSIFAAELIFHNAYGPDKDWFYDRTRSGGGCVVDLGVHLIDLALWTLDFPQVQDVAGKIMFKGRPLEPNSDAVEDYATAALSLASGCEVRLACSWRLNAGRDAVIEATFYGTEATLSMRNVNGSFYDLQLEEYRGTARETLVSPPDDWGGRAAADWVKRLAQSPLFDAACERILASADVIDRLYATAR
ncbi:Gfo/Idh/MocA family protein [Limoniibacter endophyticus]|uniref:Oxidoreductase n=1 Tax=Limoniibacter endophyticus TaxID=1565040 RepID=A0A8J3DPY8_9HYPH|nr:Gfo/Idh/MocA family oxidoreductase [Limoniibacter endophyticus]GHC72406.1 oxidoreductase [Limoniibacter endophyticus]